MSETQRVIDAFSELAPRYEETVDRELQKFWGVTYPSFIEMLLEKLNFDGARVVLDVATGRGEIPLALTKRRGWHGRVVGLDITSQMLHGARDRVTRAGEQAQVDLVCGTGVRLPFAAGSFDTAICALATHHMQVPSLLQELRRVLRPGAQVVLADIALPDVWHSWLGRFVLRSLALWYSLREGAARMRAELDAVPNMRTPDQWRSYLVEFGFSEVQLTSIPARHTWYPPGILVRAASGEMTGENLHG